MGNSNGKRYSEEFKQGAIKFVLENKQSVAEVCRNLGMSRNALERWLAQKQTAMMTIKFGCTRRKPKSGRSEEKKKI